MDDSSIVICCGPEASGTRLLTEIVNVVLRVKAIHLSQPHGPKFWAWEDVHSWGRREGAKDIHFVVITRRPDVVDMSALYKGYLGLDLQRQREQRRHAMTLLAGITGAYWISYEALVADPHTQIGNLARWLDVPFDPARIARSEKGWAQLDAEDTAETRRARILEMHGAGVVEVRDENAKWLRIIER